MASLQIQENISLAPFTTMGVGGPARFFVRVTNEKELAEANAFARLNHLPLFALGGGSNLLVHDEGFPGLVVHLDLQGEPIVRTSGDTTCFDVAAGVSWDEFVLMTCNAGLSGIECLAGVPGSTGGTPVQNVGAYGQEVSTTLAHVRVFDRRSSSFGVLEKKDCAFGYRTSLFNSSARSRYLVSSVRFSFDRRDRPKLSYADLVRRFPTGTASPLEIYHAVREIRRGKGMLLDPEDPNSRSAGSFFKNPIVSRDIFARLVASLRVDAATIPHWVVTEGVETPGGVKLAAAWLVENAGFAKGFVFGKVGISEHHSLALINRGNACCADVIRFREVIRAAVLAKFGISLQQEPVELTSEWVDRV